MVFRARHGNAAYIISLKSHSIAVSRDETLIAAWDLGGRLYSLYDGTATWRRALDGRVLQKPVARPMPSCCDDTSTGKCVLDGSDAGAIVDRASRLAIDTAQVMSESTWHWAAPIEPHDAQVVAAYLALCGRFTSAAAAADAARFAAVYRPVGILPPDQYLSLVVQATEGCSFNTCTFCDLYHDGYRVKPADEFAAHVRAVRAYLGESARLRSRGLFLGAANALAVPMARLVPLFEVLVDELEAIPRGVFAFVDAFTGSLKTASDYRHLSHLGLRRVYIGLESGHDPLLKFVQKPGQAADAVAVVRTMKEAGLQVGVIVMTGLGGARYADAHVSDTIAAVKAMDLGDGDLVYFSDLVNAPGAAYPRLAADAAVGELSRSDRAAQRAALRAGIGSGVKCATYDIREFTY